MIVVQINTVCGTGSTGIIAEEISKVLTQKSIENYILYTNNHSDYEYGIRYSTRFLIKLNAAKAAVLGNYGFNSKISTLRLIKILDKIKPDIVHLHNIHGHDLNLEKIFKYLKRKKIKVIWTFHDCWAFTGYCMHFDSIDCQKWQEECKNCPQAKRYSMFVDKSNELYLKKKKLFCIIDDMIIVTPSNWLAQLVKKSFLHKYPVEVINNGIDLDIFVPRESDFRKQHGIEDKKMVLGIPKGKLKYFIDIAKIMSDEYKLVLVGLSENEIQSLPENILGLPKTRNRIEMAEIFTASDVFINTTLEDTFPTVNLESQACGTPVVTFNTGGSPECIDDKTGIVVPKRDINAMYAAVKKICEGTDRSDDCIQRAHRLYNAKERFNDYLDLYKK